jgi:hypothetical protein
MKGYSFILKEPAFILSIPQIATLLTSSLFSMLPQPIFFKPQYTLILIYIIPAIKQSSFPYLGVLTLINLGFLQIDAPWYLLLL